MLQQYKRQCCCCCCQQQNKIIILLLIVLTSSTFDSITNLNYLQACCWIVLPNSKRFPYRGIISDTRMKHITSLSLFRRQHRQQQQQQQTPSPPPYIQVISDVDDTLKSSGGLQIFNIALGGIDVQYKRNTIYPGVAEFMFQLSYGPTYKNSVLSSSTTSASSNQVTKSITPKIAILTARAYELKLFLEMKSNDTLPKLFRTVGNQYLNIPDWGFGPILYGSIVEWIVQNRKGLRKFHNFEQLLSLTQQQFSNNTTTTTPLLNYIYVGDTGEYDEEAGIAMLYEYPQYVRAIFLHVVSRNIHHQTNITIPSTRYIQGRPIIYFRTYIGAAISALQYGLISIDGLQCVMNAVSLLLNDMNHVPPFTDDQRFELQRDMDRANQLLKFLK
jgi:hypothetical protein